MRIEANKKDQYRFITLMVVFFFALGFFPSCKKEAKNLSKPKRVYKEPPKAILSEKTEDIEEMQEKPVYVYTGDRFRDPFTELGKATIYQPDAIFLPDQAKLKAVIYSRRLRSALISIPGGGSYFVKNGRIFDIMGKNVVGFKAKIFPEKVVITGDEDDVFELSIRAKEDGTEDEEEKAL